MLKWNRCTCCYCGKQIEVKIDSDRIKRNPDLLNGNSCYRCVSENSPARNGMDESAYETRFVPKKVIIKRKKRKTKEAKNND